MKFYFSSQKESSNFKNLKKKFFKKYQKYIEFANFDVSSFTSIKYLPPKLEEQFENNQLENVIDFIVIQLPAYYRDQKKENIQKLLNDLWAVYLKKFENSTSLREI